MAFIIFFQLWLIWKSAGWAGKTFLYLVIRWYFLGSDFQLNTKSITFFRLMVKEMVAPLTGDRATAVMVSLV